MKKNALKAKNDKLKKHRHDPLDKQVLSDKFVDPEKQKRRKKSKSRNTEDEEEYVDAKLSKRILQQAKEQQDELMREEKQAKQKRKAANEDEMEDVEEVTEEELQAALKPDEDDDAEDEEIEDEEYDDEFDNIDPQEEAEVNQFISATGQRFNLAEAIMNKIKEKERAEAAASGALGEDGAPRAIPKKAVAVYRAIGNMMKTYRSGALPKAFKIIPALSNWEDVLDLTNPGQWSPQAVYQGTRVFSANLNNKMAQRFYNMVLLPHVRNDIEANKRLNFHLFQALRKACFKPAGFYKGVILPIAASGNCTYREALIIGSALKKVSLPLVHSAAALLKLAMLPYSGSTSIIIKALLEKKYALPYKVVDALVEHFYGFVTSSDLAKQKLPVIWHQCLLTFVQRYKTDLTREQKVKIYAICRKHNHHAITPEIRRELEHSSGAVVTKADAEMAV